MQKFFFIPLITLLASLTLAPRTGMAQSRSSATYSVSSESVSAGVSDATSASYSSTGSSGLPAAAEQASEAYRATPGLSGQLAVPLGFAVTGPDQVDEIEHALFVPAIAMDDGSFDSIASEPDDRFALNPTSLFGSIDSASGILTTTAVLEAQTLSIELTRATTVVHRTVTILNSIADNFGSYAHDGLDDTWQTLHFGTDNPEAAPERDPESDGSINLKEYVLGTDPNQWSVFAPLFEASGSGTFHFDYTRSTSAAANGAVYIVEWSDTLEADSWKTQGVTSSVITDDGEGLQTMRAVIPDDDTERRFARLRVQGLPVP